MKYLPKGAWITVNRACNFRCQWCYGVSSEFSSNSNLTYETAKDIVYFLKDLDIKSLIIIGGEPTVWKDLFRFNDLCNSLLIKTTLVTNGYRFNSESFWLEYLKHPNSQVSTSLKSYDEKSSLLITKVEDFKGINNGIRKVNSKFKGHVTIVYSTLIEGRLLDTVSLAMDLGATSVSVSPCTPVSENGKFSAPFTVEYDKMVLEISTNYKKIVDLTKGKISFSLKTPLCIWPEDFIQTIIAQKQLNTVCQFQRRSGIVFDTDGKIVLCNSMLEYPVGKYGVDFNDRESFLKILNSEEVNGIYNHINSYPSKLCMECNLFSRCRGGCPIMWTVFNAEEVISSAKKRKGGG